MPRGKYTNHKGKNRRFTNPEELEEERRKEEQKKKWRQQKGEDSSEESEEETGEEWSDEESEESSSDEEHKAKGVSNLIEIEIENANRVQKTKKLSTLNTELDSSKPQLSRREREEIQKQKAQAHYQKMHAEGKTEQAQADLAGLAIIKQQREEAKKRREIEIKEKENAAKMKVEQTQKALGKK